MTEHEQNPHEDLAGFDAEREALQAALSAARNSALENWANSAAHESASVAELKRSISWRVTAPLRAIRTVQIRLTSSR